MKVIFYLLILRTLVGFLVFVTYFDESNVYGLSGRYSNEKQVQDYYRLLASIKVESDSVQMIALQNYLENNAEFEPVYHKLLERFLVVDKIEAAKSYFQQLTSKTRYRRNRYWMLAKINALQNNQNRALDTYQHAFLSESASPELIRDFAELKQSMTSQGVDPYDIKHLELTSDNQIIYKIWLHYLNKKYENALEELLRLPGKYLQNLSLLFTLGDSYLNLWQTGEADSIWQRGLKLSHQGGNLYYETLFLIGQGYQATLTGNYQDALNIYEKADSTANRIDNLYLKQLINGRVGFVMNLRGDYVGAIKKYVLAEKFARLIGSYYFLGDWLLSHAQILFVLGRYSESLQVFDECEKIINKINVDDTKIDLNIRRSAIYSYLNQDSYAKKILTDAYELAHKLNMSAKQSFIKALIADILVKEGLYSEARNAYRKYIEFLITGSTLRAKAYWIGKIAETYVRERAYERAKAEYLRAVATAEKAGSKTYMAWYQLQLAEIEVLLGHYEEAIREYKNITESETAKNDKEMLAQGYLGLGNAYKKSNNLKEAILNYQTTAQITEDLRKDLTAEQLRISYFGENLKAYRNLVDCYFQRYLETKFNTDISDIDSLFYYAELSRSRALKEHKFRKGSNSKNDEYLQAIAQLRMIQRLMRYEIWQSHSSYHSAQLQAQLEAARYELVSQRLRLFDDTRSNKQNQLQQLHPLSTVRKDLKQAKLGLLYYHISDDASFVLVATEDSVKIVRLQISPSSLVSAIDSLISPLHNVREDSVLYTPFKTAVAHELYQQLVKPAEDVFNLPERLLIVPDLALMNLPFEMLLVKPPDKPEYTPMDSPTYANHFLQNRYTFVYSPSTSLLQDSPKPISNHPNVMVFANPFSKTSDSIMQEKQVTLRTGWRFDPLIFSKLEAEGIKSVYSKTRIYEGENATKETFFKAASQQQVLHFATHAFADTMFDAFSGLVLAVSKDSTDDGMLMGYEISDLNLNCDLVTLSACETGRGKLVAGEGVLGLPRLFLGAGTNTVLMTQWKVDDKFASELMPEFYRYYLKEGCSKIDAFGEAKRNVLQRQDKGATGYYQHPFFWASFTLYGDPGRERKPAVWPKVAIISVVLILIITVTFYTRSRNRAV